MVFTTNFYLEFVRTSYVKDAASKVSTNWMESFGAAILWAFKSQAELLILWKTVLASYVVLL